VWILVVGPERAISSPDGAVETLQGLGCTVKVADIWDPLEGPELTDPPPTAIMIEAMEEVDAARAALLRLRAVGALAKIPAVIAVTVPGLSRVKPEDAFDDLVLVPYVPAELYLRLRRVEWRQSDFAGAERIKIGSLCIDVAAHEVTVDDRQVELTQQEFALLRFLCDNRGRVFSRQRLLERVWGVDYYGSSRTVDIHVRRLRQKLGTAIDGLQTVRGVGYKMRAP